MKFGGIMEYAMCERKNTLVETRHGTSLQAHRMAYAIGSVQNWRRLQVLQ